VSPCQASRRRHVRSRSEGLAPSSRCVARPRSGLHTTGAERNHNIRIPGFASDMTPIALAQEGAAPATQSAQSTKKGAQGTQKDERASCASSHTGGTSQARGQADVESHRPPPIVALFSEYFTCTAYIRTDMIKRQNIESNTRLYLKTQNGRANNGMRTCRGKSRFQRENVVARGRQHRKAAELLR
jgi:hypothetical protein